jgi:hypothetical protein
MEQKIAKYLKVHATPVVTRSLDILSDKAAGHRI